MNQQNNQFVISYELLHLLQWIVEHGSEKLKKMVGKALAGGLRERIQKSEAEGHPAQEMQESIVEFFALLEGLLGETMNEQALLKAHQKNLIPALDQIDTSICDNRTVQSSLEKATTQMRHNPEANAHDLLYQEILKRWKPNKKSTLN